jgi:hypothetical protein
MSRLSHSSPETVHIHSRASLLVRIFHLICDGLKGCCSPNKKSPSLYEITNVFVIQLSNTRSKPLLNVFLADSFGSDQAIIRPLHKISKSRDFVYILGCWFPTLPENIHYIYIKHVQSVHMYAYIYIYISNTFSLCVCVYIYIYTYIHTYIHIYIHTYIHI